METETMTICKRPDCWKALLPGNAAAEDYCSSACKREHGFQQDAEKLYDGVDAVCRPDVIINMNLNNDYEKR